ncbi:epoxide hydrolase 1-like [Paramacrobiotus metropolitanus]|uniref:epoxide hydrolase 1-like n=1 Tax=Paramacrobiotus metropolitanus TaxID=2943436 RepID=UPI002445F0ED|nr:epoxide hydrolase 1-like [Paramacrobiotus metropolitanus]
MAKRRSPFYLSLKAKFFLFTICTGVLLAIFAYQIENVLHYVRPLSRVDAVFPFTPQTWTLAPEAPSDRIEPFVVQASDEVLADLRYRLQHTRFGPPLSGVNFQYGFPSTYLREVVDYWLNSYDWKKQEKFINQYIHFTTKIEGLNIHFVRAEPKEKDVRILPIILLHGWPGSFYELYKLIPLLTTPQKSSCGVWQQVAFEVIIPSLPGYGFSQAAQKPGLDTAAMARMFHTLMTRLGFQKYFIHGGDWGSLIGRTMAVMYPDSVHGLELTMYPIPMIPSLLKNAVASFIPSWFVEHHEADKLFFHNVPALLRETGYMHIQATKPDTVGAALSDSPAGLAAYIMEKFSTWTNDDNIQHPKGNLAKYFDMDDLINNVMIYWISNSIMSSQRLYKEVFATDYDTYLRYPVKVPTMLSDFFHELRGANPPTEYVRPYFTNLLKVSAHSTGGHFPAMERPNDIAEDIRALGLAVIKC